MHRDSFSCLTFALTLTASLLLLLAPASAISGKIVAKLSASDNGPNSYFGAAVAISADGKTIAVAAPGAEVNNGTGEEVYIYEKPAGGWSNMTQVARLYSSNCPFTRATLASMAITSDGSTIVYQCMGPPSMLAVGPINVFIRPAGGWQDGRPPDANFHSPNGSYGSGLAVGPNGNTITTTGSTYDDETGKTNWYLYLFNEPAGGWTNNMTPTQTVRLATAVAQGIPGPVAMTKGWVATAIAFNSTLYLFHHTATSLEAAGSVSPNSGAIFSLAMNDSEIFVGGAYYPDSFPVPAAFVFAVPKVVGDPPTEIAHLLPPFRIQSVAQVALSGKDLLVESLGHAPDLFVEPPTGGWQTTSHPNLTLDVPNGYDNDTFPFGQNTLRIAGNVVVSGDEWGGTSNSGAAYVYELSQ